MTTFKRSIQTHILTVMAIAFMLALGLTTASLGTAKAQAPSQSTQTPGAPVQPPANQSTPPGIGGGPAPTFFGNLNFSTTPDGPPMTVFPAGTQYVYARFDYANVPAGAVMIRQWFRDGQLYLNRTEAWNPAYSGTGRLTTISIFDTAGGLPGGNYMATFVLNGYPNSLISAGFTIQAGVVYPTQPPYSTQPPYPTQPPYVGAVFYNLTTSTSPGGAPIINFGAGTRAVYLRFNYANIPIGALVRREWYLNNVLYTSNQDIWSSYWGSNGRLTHISLYDYNAGGLPVGNYRVLIYLPNFPGVRIEATFIIHPGAPTGSYFRNLSFGTSSGSPAYSWFYAYTRVIYARWQFANTPTGVWLLKRWYRNGSLWIERREGWYRSGSGTVYTTIYDYQYGLQPGNYYVEISLEGVPNSTVTGNFRVG